MAKKQPAPHFGESKLKKEQCFLPCLKCFCLGVSSRGFHTEEFDETLEATARAIFKSWFVDFDPVKAKMEGRKPPCMDTSTAALFPSAFQDSSLEKIRVNNQQSHILSKIRDTLLPELLSEEIRVDDAKEMLEVKDGRKS